MDIFNEGHTNFLGKVEKCGSKASNILLGLHKAFDQYMNISLRKKLTQNKIINYINLMWPTLFLIYEISVGSGELLCSIVIGLFSALEMIVLGLTMQEEDINEHINVKCRANTFDGQLVHHWCSLSICIG